MWNWFLAGGPVMWPLLLCSLVSLTVIVERCLFWVKADLRQDRNMGEQLLEDYRLGGPDWTPESAASGTAKGMIKGAITRMLLTGMAHHNFSSPKAMEAVALDEISKMRRGMNVLDTIITVAPMLGILGTVTGIITSFDMLGQVGVDDPKAVVAGIAEALITTAAGLVISVGTVFPYNYFNARIDDAVALFEHYGTRLEILENTKTARLPHEAAP